MNINKLGDKIPMIQLPTSTINAIITLYPKNFICDVTTTSFLVKKCDVQSTRENLVIVR